MIPGQASAQDEQSDEADDSLLEEVVVTGSRLITEDGFGRTSPVTVVGLDAIEQSGYTRMEDVLNNLPSIETSFQAFDANGATGTATVDLRGLGTNRTLVLLNGRRMQPGGVYTEAPDINQIPASMVERVEVLTGGASATYGADAVAGVVNFIMRRIDGVEVSAGWSGYQHDNSNGYIQEAMDRAGYSYPTGDSGLDGDAYNFDIVIGGDFADGRGNATVYATWRKNNELREEARDYSSCALGASGVNCSGSASAPNPNFFIYGTLPDGSIDYDVPVTDFFQLTPTSGLAPYDGSNTYNFAPINFFMRPDERWSAGAFVDFEINEHATGYLEANFANDRTKAQIAESGTFFFEPYFLPITNSLFPQAFRDSLNQYFPGEDEFAIYIGKRNTEGGPRSDNLEHTGFRIVAGVRGVLTDNWDYDVSFLHGQTSSSSTYLNDLLAPNIRIPVNGELCAATQGCIPYNVFTYQGVTPESAVPLAGVGIQTNQTTLTNVLAYITGNLGFGLPAGDITLATGYQYGKPEYENISDTVYEEGLLLGQGGPQPSVAGAYSVDELFVEANVPLLSGVPLVEALALDLAYRWSDYTTGFDTSTYRFGFDWQTIESVRLRAGYNRAVRAPSITELFIPANIGLWSGTDPCAGSTPEYSAAQCALTGVTAAQYGNISLSPAGQYNQLAGGNVNLQPEEADTITAGIVWDPLDDMTVSVDYWDIDIDGVIDNVESELTVRQCAEFGALCENIIRAPNGSLWQGQAGYVVAQQLNLGNQHWEGVDLAWNYSVDGWGGSWNMNLIGTYMLTKETTPIPGVETSTYDCVGIVNTQCFPAPEWRHVASATYDSESWWAVTGRWRFYDDVFYDGTADQIANDQIETTNYFDVSAVFRFMANSDVVVGVNNIIDEEPPLVGNTLSGGINNANSLALYDQLGRYLFGNVTFRW